MDALLGKAREVGAVGSADIIEIAVSPAGTVTGLSVTVPGTKLKTIAEDTEAALCISSPRITVTFDNAALDVIAEEAGGAAVTLLAGAASPGTPLTEAEREKLADRPAYDLKVRAGGKTVSDFGDGNAAVSIPYILRPGENPDAVVVWYLDADGNLQAVPNGHYQSETGKVVFKTAHFRDFILGYNLIEFSDVSEDAWYEKAVTFIAARGITAGTGENTFSPDARLTRGQFLVLLLRAYGIAPDADPSDNFADAGDSWYTGYLSAAKRLGLSNGIGDNLFAPEREISRQDMFTLLYRTLDLLSALPEAADGGGVADYGDAGKIADYARDPMDALVKGGIVTGSSGTLDPLGTSTRAQMAQVLYKLLSK
jgi:hypothetical protein